MAPRTLASSIFLIPNGTFFVVLIIFVIVVLVLGWYVAPAISKALREREEMVKREAEESRSADEQLRQAEQRYAQALTEARAESGRIKDTARSEGQQILDEQRGQATEQANEVAQRATDELSAQRAQAMRELQPHVRELAATLAGRIVGEDIPVSGGRR